MDTFSPIKTPTIETTVTFTAEVLQANFGDGYEQTAATGLNSVRGVYQVNWDLLSQDDRDLIEAFFATHLGSQAFQYTFPDESTPRKFKCKTWTRGNNGGLFTLRAELREVFDLA